MAAATTKLDYSTGTRKDFDGSYADVVTIDDKTSMKITLQPGFDWCQSIAPKLPGCPSWCPATHFGYLESGCMKVKYEDGSETTVNAGESYLIPPKHLPEVVGDAPAVMVEFSQSTAQVVSSMKESTTNKLGNEIPFGADSPFILIARCHVKEECLDEYMKAAEIADKAVMATEGGMLHHTFDQDPDDPLMFTWSEVYKNDAALLLHLTNPPLVKFVEQHGEMGDKFEIEVYGTLSVETKEAFSASGFPIKYFDTMFGYSRIK